MEHSDAIGMLWWSACAPHEIDGDDSAHLLALFTHHCPDGSSSMDPPHISRDPAGAFTATNIQAPARSPPHMYAIQPLVTPRHMGLPLYVSPVRTYRSITPLAAGSMPGAESTIGCDAEPQLCQPVPHGAAYARMRSIL